MNYPIYLKRTIPGTDITMSHVMVIEVNKSIYVSATAMHIEKNVLNEKFYIEQRGFIPSTKEEFDNEFVNTSHELLKEAGSFDSLKSA